MVGTFLNEESNGLQKTRITTTEVIPATKTESEKVTNMVGTFLSDYKETN